MEMYRKTFAEIDLDALEHNISVLQKALPEGTFLCPMVKANAYGHGDVQMAKALEMIGVKTLGVCLIEEGLLLRNFGVKCEILVFRGFDREGAKKIVQYQMTPVVSSWEHLDHLEAIASSPISIHLKFDTGMNRLGFAVSEASQLYDRLWQNPKIRLNALVTHLSHGEDAASSQGRSARQLTDLLKAADVLKAFQPKIHALNSAGIVHYLHFLKNPPAGEHPLTALQWGCRPGLMIYGLNPVREGYGCDLKPVMSLKSQVAVFRKLKAGESVSYGGTWVAPKDSVVAVVPIGYADGYHRTLSNKAEALFRGHRVPVVGAVCMDYLMLDVTDALAQSPDVGNDEVTLFGTSGDQRIGPDELAQHAGTITWEILTSVGERVPRVYRGRKAALLNEETGS